MNALKMRANKSSYSCMYLVPTEIYEKLIKSIDERDGATLLKLNNARVGNENGAFPMLPPPGRGPSGASDSTDHGSGPPPPHPGPGNYPGPHSAPSQNLDRGNDAANDSSSDSAMSIEIPSMSSYQILPTADSTASAPVTAPAPDAAAAPAAASGSHNQKKISIYL